MSPQGKILFDFFLIRDGEEFLIDIDGAQVDDLIRRLTFYRLRADVQFEPGGEDFGFYAIWGGEKPDHASQIVVADPRLEAMGWRTYSTELFDKMINADHSDYQCHRITVGMPEGGKDYSYGKAFPHEALYDQANGVDFTKGCYVGQEVVSRMHHRATARKRVIQVVGEGRLPQSGTKITILQKSVGELVSVCDRMGLAMLRLDHIRRALDAGDEIVSGDVILKPNIQPWANFNWPEA